MHKSSIKKNGEYSNYINKNDTDNYSALVEHGSTRFCEIEAFGSSCNMLRSRPDCERVRTLSGIF